jgi:hypothetical protein
VTTDVDPLGPARVGWEESRAALADVAASTCRLLRSLDRPTRSACGAWNVAETAAHLSHAWQALTFLAARDLDGLRATLPEVPGLPLGLPSGALLRPQDSLDALTTGLVKADPERDLRRLADRIETAAKGFCDQFDPAADPGPRPWMIEGVTGGPELFACHLLSETLVHAHDIARAADVKWPMSESAAALVFRGFLLPIMVAFSTVRAAAGASVDPFVVDLRLAGDRRFLVHNTPAGVRIQAPGAAPADASVWIRPMAMTLMAWNRRPMGTVVRSGQMAVWGRRPWMARKLMTLAPGR